MKKKLAATLSVVLILGLAVLGILAYLTDTDSDVNVMTLGNVDIEQYEKDQNGKPFEDQPLFPAVGELTETNGYWTNANVVDKRVTVENTGKSDAFVRTWFAFEYGDADSYAKVKTNLNGNDAWDWTDITEIVEIDDVQYKLAVATYKTALKPGDITPESLRQVALNYDADNDDMTAFGEEYHILVVSQAGQTEGFADATSALTEMFGAATAENHPFEGLLEDIWDGKKDTSWYNDTDTEFTLTTAEQLAGFEALVNSGNTFAGKTVKLGKNINLNNLQWTPIGNWNTSVFSGTFDGQDYTVRNLKMTKTNASGTERLGFFGYIKNATVKNIIVSGADISADANTARGAVLVMCADGTSNNVSGIIIKDSKVTMKSVGQTYANGVVAWANIGTSMSMSDITVSGLELTASQTSGNPAEVAPILGYLNQADGKSSSLVGFKVENVTIDVKANKARIGGALGDINKGNVTVTDGTVNGLTITATSTGENDIGGLLGYTYKVDPLKIADVTVSDIDIDFTGSSSRVGGITGWDQSVSRETGGYSNVSVSGTIDENATGNTGSEVGGFVGISYQYPKTYTGCSADVDVTATNRVGGFVGTPCTNGWANSTDAYNNCTAKGDVKGAYAGGFAGCAWLNASVNTTLLLNGVKAEGSVTATEQGGGLIGSAWGSNNACSNIIIKDSVAAKNVTGTLVGGVVGIASMGSGKTITLENVTSYITPEINYQK